jgi:hypothetical protein
MRRLELLALLALACAQPNPAPPSWRRNLEDAQRSPLGAWTAVTLRDGRMTSGELLAAGDEGLLLGAGMAATHVPRQCLALVRVGGYDASNTAVVLGGVVGGLATITHGFFAIISAPIYLTTFVYNAYSLSGKGHFDLVPGARLRTLAPWARFPQGLPAPFRERLTLSWVDLTCGA